MTLSMTIKFKSLGDSHLVKHFTSALSHKGLIPVETEMPALLNVSQHCQAHRGTKIYSQKNKVRCLDNMSRCVSCSHSQRLYSIFKQVCTSFPQLFGYQYTLFFFSYLLILHCFVFSQGFEF